MVKQIIFNEEARSKIKNGVATVARAVGVTIGPFGRNVAIQKPFGGPIITNDGVSITKEISVEDPFENIGVDIIKEVANKTNELAGDGTSTSVILAEAMIEEGLKQIDKGVNSLSIRNGMNIAHKMAQKKLLEMKRDVTDDKEIVHIASVSAENDKYGKIIAETVKKVGNKGVISVEESQSFNVESEIVEGLEIDKGYVSPYMVTNPERLEAEYKDVPVLITDKKISSMKEILPFLEKITQRGNKDLVIIADDIEGEALTTFVLNRLRGTFNVLGIKAPGFGDEKKNLLGDIAVTIGAQIVSKDTGVSFADLDLDVLGRAGRVTSKKDKTVILGSSENKLAVEERIKSLEKELENIDNKFDIEKTKERIAKLSGGVGVVRVGAPTESEMKYLKLKIEDAVNATKAALEEGVIIGGGAAFAHISKHLREDRDSINWGDEYEEKGYMIVVNALEAPLSKIVDNALGESEGKVIVRGVQNRGGTSGYDAFKKDYVDDMFEVGIIDPLKVARSGLENAVSTVGIFLTIDVAITDVPDKEKSSTSPMMDGMY